MRNAVSAAWPADGVPAQGDQRERRQRHQLQRDHQRRQVAGGGGRGRAGHRREQQHLQLAGRQRPLRRRSAARPPRPPASSTSWTDRARWSATYEQAGGSPATGGAQNVARVPSRSGSRRHERGDERDRGRPRRPAPAGAGRAGRRPGRPVRPAPAAAPGPAPPSRRSAPASRRRRGHGPTPSSEPTTGVDRPSRIARHQAEHDGQRGQRQPGGRLDRVDVGDRRPGPVALVHPAHDAQQVVRRQDRPGRGEGQQDQERGPVQHAGGPVRPRHREELAPEAGQPGQAEAGDRGEREQAAQPRRAARTGEPGQRGQVGGAVPVLDPADEEEQQAGDDAVRDVGDTARR